MKQYKFFLLLITFISCTLAVAQPPKRRAQLAAKKTKTTQTSPRGTSYRLFPTSPAMPEDVVWKRDIYRKLSLKNEANAVLSYPLTPQNGRCNLFTFLMKSLLRRQIKAYRYNINTGTESFDPKEEITAKQIMDDKGIFYEIKDGRMRVEDSDLSLEEVKKYYIKESIYYNQHTATFHTKVVALCPVIVRGDGEFGGSDMEYPVCWFNYAETAPLLHKLMLMESSLNNASMISAADFFTMNRYKGDIYKVTNLQDKMLVSQTPGDTTLLHQRKVIEKELKDFKKEMWNTTAPIDTAAQRADSIAAQKEQTTKSHKEKITRRRSSSLRSKYSKTKKQKSTKQKKTKRIKSAPQKQRSNGLSVRRQRH